MIVSKFKSDADLDAFADELILLFNLTANAEGRYPSGWGEKTRHGLARTVERLYRKRVYGEDETVPEDERYYAANVSGEDPQWPTKPVDR